MFEVKDHKREELRDQTAHFLAENTKMREKYDGIDWTSVYAAEGAALELKALV
jgi:hypothetical protein